jgi:uncharacterized protein
VARYPRALVAVGAIGAIAALAVLPRYLGDPFEYDFRRLRTPLDPDVAEVTQRADQIYGRSQSPIVFLADNDAQVPELAAAIRARDQAAGGHIVGRITTLADFIPGTAAEQRQKLATIAEIRGLVGEARDLASPEDAEKLAKWTPPDDLAVIQTADLPEGILHPFRDRTCEIAPLVVVYRASQISNWDGHDLLKLSSVVRAVPVGGEVKYSTGNAVIFAGMLEAILNDGPLATLVSFLGVVLIVIVLARGLRGAAIVVGALLLGVLWTIGAAALLDVRINVVDFIALPITFGIGVDYAINIYVRLREEPERAAHVVRTSGGAVALCSLTTTIGYASLLVAANHALRSFGQLAILGELGCVLAALLVTPAAFAVARSSTRRRRRASSPVTV